MRWIFGIKVADRKVKDINVTAWWFGLFQTGCEWWKVSEVCLYQDKHNGYLKDKACEWEDDRESI